MTSGSTKTLGSLPTRSSSASNGASALFRPVQLEGHARLQTFGGKWIASIITRSGEVTERPK